MLQALNEAHDKGSLTADYTLDIESPKAELHQIAVEAQEAQKAFVNDKVYTALSAEIDALDASLQEAVKVIATECPDVADNFTQSLDALKQKVDALRNDLDARHAAGTLTAQGGTAVLVSHNIVECMDPDLPASLSPAVHDLLRELGFDGVAMTDDLAMDAVAAYAADGAVAVMAIQAGNDMVVTTDYRTQIPKVIEAVESGTLNETAIDTACYRVLAWKQALGLLEGLI